jgi:uncharacterized membrane protein YsdA (DUF1294 family)
MVDMSGVFGHTRVTFKARDCNKSRPRVGQEVLRCVVDDATFTATAVELAPYSLIRALLFRVDVRIGIIASIAILAVWLLLAVLLPRSPVLWRWLGCVNAVALCAFLVDKWSSAKYGGRVPELLLLALAALGGSGGALAGVVLFRHKSTKVMFLLAILCIIAAQSVWWTWWLTTTG